MYYPNHLCTATITCEFSPSEFSVCKPNSLLEIAGNLVQLNKFLRNMALPQETLTRWLDTSFWALLAWIQENSTASLTGKFTQTHVFLVEHTRIPTSTLYVQSPVQVELKWFQQITHKWPLHCCQSVKIPCLIYFETREHVVVLRQSKAGVWSESSFSAEETINYRGSRFTTKIFNQWVHKINYVV